MSTLLHSQDLADRTIAETGDPRRDLVFLGRWLYRLGFAPGTAGNLSVRLDDGTLLVTPTGANKHMLRRRDLLLIDLEGRVLEGTRRPTSELGMHLAFYQQREDVRAVIHAHPPLATAFACSGRALEELICQEAAMTLGPVPLARYATTGTDEVAESLRSLIPHHDAILLASHGAVTCGPSLFEAFFRMETLEHVAQIRLAAEQLGSCQVLDPGQADGLEEARQRYMQNAAVSGLQEMQSGIRRLLARERPRNRRS